MTADKQPSKGILTLRCCCAGLCVVCSLGVVGADSGLPQALHCGRADSLVRGPAGLLRHAAPLDHKAPSE